MAAPPAKTAAAQKAAQVNKFEHVGKKKSGAAQGR
jgi:hypothetical protein